MDSNLKRPSPHGRALYLRREIRENEHGFLIVLTLNDLYKVRFREYILES